MSKNLHLNHQFEADAFLYRFALQQRTPQLGRYEFMAIFSIQCPDLSFRARHIINRLHNSM